MVTFSPHMLAVPGAWAFFGTYPVPIKSPAIMQADTDPVVLQLFKSSWVCITSWLVLLWTPFSFTPLGFVGAACWVPAGVFYITAVKLCGVAYVTPISSGLQVAVAFCWGKFYFHEPMKNVWIAVAAMLIMVVGMVGISYSCNYEKIQKRKEEEERRKKFVVHVGVNEDVEAFLKNGADETTPLTHDPKNSEISENFAKNSGDAENPKKGMGDMTLGLFLSVACALTGGSMNVPLKKAPPGAHGIQYVISFGIGALTIAVGMTLIYVIARYFLNKGLPKVNLRVSFIPASIAGILWSAGNICSIYTTLYYGVTVGTPLVQCNMMVAGCWGVFYYDEAPRTSMKLAFMGSCAVLIGGTVLLSIYG